MRGLRSRCCLGFFWIVYISVFLVAAAGGFAFTATHFSRRRKVSKRLCPSIRCLAKARHALTKALLRGQLPRHPCRGAPCATPAFGLWERGGRSEAKATAKQDQKIVRTRPEPSAAPERTHSPCRSEPARDEFKGNAFFQTVRVFVHVHREQARSHNRSAYNF
jgi:hypothetical protein